MGNRALVEEAIKQEMGESKESTVEHTCGCPFCVVTEVNGQQSARECLPFYFMNAHTCGCDCLGGHEQTAKNAKEAYEKSQDVAPGSVAA